jgi:L-asparaginase
MLPRVLFIFTGGTISMKIDPVTGGAVPALSGREILAYDPTLAELAEIEVIDFGRLPGPHWTPAAMWELSELTRAQIQRPDLDGIVITHGTDTLEETAYLVDLRHVSPKPIAFVGAMRNTSELSFDGPANLRAALRTVIEPDARGQGVFVVLNMLIHAASAATKSDTQSLETFTSPVFGPLGMVDTDRVLFARALPRRALIETSVLEPRVDLLLTYAGFDGRFIDAARECGVRGLVLEGTGRGNVPPAALPALDRLLAAGIPVVLSTRCPQGRVLDTYAYEGSGHDLRRRGVLFAGALTGPKARVHLMLALGATREPAALRQLVEQGRYRG